MTDKKIARRAKAVAAARTRYGVAADIQFAYNELARSWASFDGDTVTIQQVSTFAKRPTTKASVPVSQISSVITVAPTRQKAGYVRLIPTGAPTTEFADKFGYMASSDPHAALYFLDDAPEFDALADAIRAAIAAR